MNYMKDLDVRLTKIDDTQATILAKLAKMEDAVVRRIDGLEARNPSTAKLVDRLIEMSMVIKGESPTAVIHRGQSRLESGYVSPETTTMPDGSPVVEDTWPPEGCDVMELNG